MRNINLMKKMSFSPNMETVIKKKKNRKDLLNSTHDSSLTHAWTYNISNNIKAAFLQPSDISG